MANVLLVDNEAVLQASGTTDLRKSGHEVFTASGMEVALHVLNTTCIDVVVTEVILRDQTGMDLMEHIRVYYPFVQVIFLTKYPTVQTTIQAMRLGAFDYLSKPISLKELEQTILRAAQTKKELEEKSTRWQEVNKRRLQKQRGEEDIFKTTCEFEQEEDAVETFIEFTPDAIFILDEAGTLLFANRVANEIMGVTSLEGKKLSHLFPSKSLEEKIFRLKDAIQTGTSYIIEEKIPIGNHEHWFRLCVQPLEKTADLPPRALIIASDIHEQKLIQHALEESEKRYRHLVENIGDGIAVVDQNERFIYANPATERIFGVGGGELIGRSLLAYIADETQEELLRNQTQLRKRGLKSSYELRIRRENGKERTLMLTATPETDASGNYIGASGILRDITRQKEDAQMLQRSEEKYRLLVEMMTDGICILDNQEIVFANEPFCKMISVRLENILGMPFPSFLPADEAKRLIELQQRHLAGERNMGIFTTVLLDINGAEVPIELDASVIDYEGRKAQMVIVRPASRRDGRKLQSA